jgi:recombination protein RecT
MTDLVTFKRNLGDLIERKELALPSNVSEDAFRNAAIIAVQDNPTILSCDPQSVFKSIRTLAAAGLVPDGREAALVPFYTKDGRKCQAMPMVFGLIKMVRRSGEVSDIRAHIVYQNEVDQGRFEYVVGDSERLSHEPILFGDKGAPVAAYAIANLKDGGIVREFMDLDQIEKVRRAGASQLVFPEKGQGGKPTVSATPKGIWADWWDEMVKKSVIRRLCKRLDMSSEDMRRVMVEQDEMLPPRDVTPKEPGGFAKLAQAARGNDPVTGEVMPSDDELALAADAARAAADAEAGEYVGEAQE